MSALEADQSVIEAIKGLTRAQRRALDSIAVGHGWGRSYSSKTIKALLDAGLIVRTYEDRYYGVPIRVHIAWTKVVIGGAR